ncbi:MAG: hypothetical protein LBE86_07745 [Gemmobacter sp.]|jgi:hypothetical protein|nr:hypothetical protein [Gemmobacter sp.]
MNAMERTNIMLAKILDRAMSNGVSHWTLEFGDLGLSDEFGTYFFPCIEWLEAEGLIRVGACDRLLGGVAAGCARNIALTAKGMAVLGAQIDVQGRREPLSVSVKQVSEGKVDYNRIGDAIGGLIGGFLKSMSG